MIAANSANTVSTIFGTRRYRRLALPVAFCITLCAVATHPTFAQAPPGPLGPAASPDPSEMAPARPLPPPPPPRNPIGSHPNIAGIWIINRDDSDDPRRKMREAEGNANNPRRNNGGMGGPSGWPGGGPYGRNGPYGGGPNGPYGGNNPNNPSNPQGGYGDNNPQDPGADLTKLTIMQTPSTAKVVNASDQVIANYTAPASEIPASAAPSTAPAAQSPQSGSASSSTGASPASAPANTSSPSSPAPSPSPSSSPVSSKNAPTYSALWKDNEFVTVKQETTGQKLKTTSVYELSSKRAQLQVTTTIEGPHLKRPVTFLLVYDPSTVQPDQ